MTGPSLSAHDSMLQLLRDAVHDGVFPGAVGAVGQLIHGKPVAVVAAEGRLAPGLGPVDVDTVYDLASLTKPVVASVALRLSQHAGLDLHCPVATWIPEIEGTLGGAAPLALLLSHRAGLSPWGSLFRETPDAPKSAATRAYFV